MNILLALEDSLRLHLHVDDWQRHWAGYNSFGYKQEFQCLHACRIVRKNNDVLNTIMGPYCTVVLLERLYMIAVMKADLFSMHLSFLAIF